MRIGAPSRWQNTHKDIILPTRIAEVKSRSMLIFEKLYFSADTGEDGGYAEEDGIYVSILDEGRTHEGGITETSGYWIDGHFWESFLSDANYDHYHLVEVFKTVLGDSSIRRTIVQSILEVPFPFIYNDATGVAIDDQLSSLRRACSIAADNEMRAIATWKYPALTLPGEHETLTHFVMVFIDGTNNTALILDPRGLEYARTFHSSWQRAYEQLRRLLQVEYRFSVGETNYFDLQLGEEGEEDQFCQSWSFVLLEEFMEIYEFRSKLSSRPRLKRPRAGSWTDTDSSQLTTGDYQHSNSTASESVVSTPTGSEVSQDAAENGDVELSGTMARDHSTDHRRQKSRFEPILRLWQRCLAHPKVIISAIV